MNSGSGNSSPLSEANSSTIRLEGEVDITNWVFEEKKNWTENISSAIMDILIAALNAKRKGLQFMFSWNDVPGEDNEKLLRFLWDDLDIGWAKIAEITKSDNRKRIHIFKDENSAEITIDEEEEEKATLKIRDGETYDLKVKNENGKLNIYSLQNLLILAIKDKDYESLRRHVYIYDPERKLIYPVSGIVARDALKYYNDLIKDLKKHKLTNKNVAKSGGYLFKKLIPDVISGRLQNKLAEGPDKVKWWVWIYCNDPEFNPLWEWLYTSPSNNAAPETSNVENYKTTDKKSPHSRKSSSHPSKWACFNKILQKFIRRQQSIENNEDDGFFWGDNFFLFRVVPGECEIQEESVFEIDKVAVLRQKLGCIYSDANATYLENLCTNKSKMICDIFLEDHNALETELVKKSDPVDYILHVAARKNYITRSDSFMPVLNILKKLNKEPVLLFLNICECNSTVRSNFINSIPTKTWIDTSSAVAMNNISSCKFAEFFYEEFFDNEKNVVVAATEARKGIRDCRDLDDSHKLWRLAYAVNGNPYIKIT